MTKKNEFAIPPSIRLTVGTLGVGFIVAACSIVSNLQDENLSLWGLVFFGLLAFGSFLLTTATDPMYRNNV